MAVFSPKAIYVNVAPTFDYSASAQSLLGPLGLEAPRRQESEWYMYIYVRWLDWVRFRDYDDSLLLPDWSEACVLTRMEKDKL